MKVGIVVPFSWSFWGGVPEHADHQARALRELGFDVRVVIGHDPPGRLTKMLHPREGRHERPPAYVVPVGRSVIVPANDSLANVVLSPATMVRIHRLLRQERFDLIHVHEPITPVIATYALAAAECPIVATFHAAGESLNWYGPAARVFGVCLDRIDHRIAVSERARETAQRYLGPVPIEIVPNGVVVPPTADPGGRKPHVVFIGRHEPRKGLVVLLRAWQSVATRTGARLRVVGADPLSVRWLMRRHGLSLEGVDLLGSIREDELTRELLEASVLAAPSLGRESFGMVLTRAFGCATPVVASAIEGYSDVASPETSVLVPPGDAGALAEALVELLEDEPRRRALGLAAREVAEERYAWPRLAGRLAEIYQGLAAAPAPEAEAA